MHVPNIVPHMQDILGIHLLNEGHVQIGSLGPHVAGYMIDFVLRCRQHR